MNFMPESIILRLLHLRNMNVVTCDVELPVVVKLFHLSRTRLTLLVCCSESGFGQVSCQPTSELVTQCEDKNFIAQDTVKNETSELCRKFHEK
jgi:hypothetical protein